MKSNVIFDKKYEDIISSYEPLSKWYEKNKDIIYYHFPTRNSLNHEREYDNYDIVVLRKMITSMLNWFDISAAALSSHAKAYNATTSIAKIYEVEKENLSDEAKETLKIENEKKIRRVL